MTDEEIKCWDDAGSWETAQSLIGDSLFNRFDAVWKAIRERSDFLEIDDPTVDLVSVVKHGDGIRDWCFRIIAALEKIIPFFAAVDDDDTFACVTVRTPFCENQINVSPNARSFFQEWDLPVESPSWGRKYLYLHTVEYSMILTAEQCGSASSLEKNPLSVEFTHFTAEDLLARYPLDFSLSIAEFLWNAYRILKLLYCPIHKVEILWDPAEETYSMRKGFVLYRYANGTSAYALTPDYPPAESDLERLYTVPAEAALWNKAAWARSAELYSSVERKEISLGNNSSVWIVGRTAAGALMRNSSYYRILPNRQYEIPLNLTYDRMYMDDGSGYFAPPYPEGEWINAVDDLLLPGGTASYMENETTCPGGGTGHSQDTKRQCRLQVELDLRYASGFQFI